MITVKCLICTKSFNIKPSHQKLGWGKYCSIDCRNIAQKKGQKVLCATCMKEVYKSPAHLNHSKSGKYFCSKKCQTLWRNSFFIREKHQNWNGGGSVYREILEQTNIPQICQICKLDNKIVLVAHHLDHNRKNNDISNLIWLCLNCHYLAHHDQNLDSKLKNHLIKII